MYYIAEMDFRFGRVDTVSDYSVLSYQKWPKSIPNPNPV